MVKVTRASQVHEETDKFHNHHPHSSNGEKHDSDNVHMVFRWSRCKKPLPQKVMRSVGIPLPLEHVQEQRRKGIEMAGSNIDRLWNEVEQMNDGGNSTHKTMGQRRKSTEMARLKSGWTLLMTNLILEIASAVFDQLGYAFVGMVLAFVALLLSTAELIDMARKGRMSLLPSFHRPSTTTLAHGKPVGTIVEYFGLVGAVWQCFYSTVEYAYARQNKDNPIKMSLLPFLFLSCVVISKLMKKSYND